jgi:predicted lipid-binding transport protein (Tim44 family)
MQRIFLSLFAVFFAFALPVYEAEAKRMGGGKNFGMQRQATPMKRDASPQQTQNAPAPGQNAAAGATPKRNWMGPIAGLAAGLGIAALLSHFGLGEGVANMLMMVLLALAAFMLVRWFLNRNKPAMQQPMQYAGQGVARAVTRTRRSRCASKPPLRAPRAPSCRAASMTNPARAMPKQRRPPLRCHLPARFR